MPPSSPGAALLCLFATSAWAGPDLFGLGSGKDGPLVVSAPAVVVNDSEALAADSVAGDVALQLGAGTHLTSGDLVMVLQTVGLFPPDSGDQSRIDLESIGVGSWELARINGSGPLFTLSAPLLNGYPAASTQVIRVPEYTSVQINSGAGITAQAWDGRSGGVVVFFASGPVTLDGDITVDGEGFRPGLGVAGAGTGCADPDESAPSGGAKGEGVASSVYGTASTGLGNLANGGGGGDCACAGGGGGGNGGLGGNGGVSSDGLRWVGGLGGASPNYSLVDRLSLGGGGGAGQAGALSSGGIGGGAVMIRAQALKGEGSISAHGLPGSFGGGAVGGGGGGGGGSIFISTTGSMSCNQVDASGGAGAPSVESAPCGPGGGGGGGRILLEGSDVTGCPASALAGLAGLQQPGPGPVDPFGGATPQIAGIPPFIGDVISVSTAPDGGSGANGLTWVQVSCGAGAGPPQMAALLALLTACQPRARRPKSRP